MSAIAVNTKTYADSIWWIVRNTDGAERAKKATALNLLLLTFQPFPAFAVPEFLQCFFLFIFFCSFVFPWIFVCSLTDSVAWVGLPSWFRPSPVSPSCKPLDSWINITGRNRLRCLQLRYLLPPHRRVVCTSVPISIQIVSIKILNTMVNVISHKSVLHATYTDRFVAVNGSSSRPIVFELMPSARLPRKRLYT